jgi:hypothetical protein
MLSCTLPSRDSVAGSALALIDIEDIPNLHFKAQAPGEGDWLICICDLHLACDVCITSMAGLGTAHKQFFWGGPLRAHGRQGYGQHLVRVSLRPKIKFVRVPGQLDADSLNMGYSQPLCGPVGGNCRMLTVSRA